MCTVTFIPTPSGMIITSNRDESPKRSALPPLLEKVDNYQLAYPKDPSSGGTWIAIKNTGEVGVLLNGAFENHVKKPSYRKSRGHILLTILKAANTEKAFDYLDLSNIENFTLILYTNNRLLVYCWDGISKHQEEKDVQKPHIWSSATLYPTTIRSQREKWFNNWINSESKIDLEKVLSFHKNAGTQDLKNALLMQRGSDLATVSITTVQINSIQMQLLHENLVDKQITKISLALAAKGDKSLFTNWSLKCKTFSVKLLNWEYWPMHVVYAPMYIYWLYLSAKAKSLFFFSAANPSRKNAGFAMEKKSDNYQFLPQKYYPKTIICQADTKAPALKTKMEEREIYFPVMVKPEMGERGTGVELISNLISLVAYSKANPTDFLIQEYIAHSNEVGIFYHRIPEHKNGQITGIVGKELLSVKGDGNSTLKQLILKSDRHLLHFESLQTLYANEFDQILPIGFEKLLVPYGNHCRGAKFVDLSNKIDAELTTTIDQVCKQIPDFYFGRLDIKFENWEKLKKGEFTIIELNGAASEPTHIYDPKHSIFFAWIEIKRHWDILYSISQHNASTKSLKLMSTAQGIKMLKEHREHIKLLNKLNFTSLN